MGSKSPKGSKNMKRGASKRSGSGRKGKNYTLNDLFLIKLKALYDIESELVKALPKMAKAAKDPDLKAAFEDHLEETKMQAERLENAFEILGQKPAKLKCEAIRGLVADAQWGIQEKPGPEALDALIITAAARVEHYEIAGYIAAVKWAKLLGQDDIRILLEESLAEEEMADDKLESLADGGIDERALGGEDKGMGGDEDEDADDMKG